MKDYHKQLAESFRIYTDFECNMKRVKSSSDSGDNASCTEKYQFFIIFLVVFLINLFVLMINLTSQLFFVEEKNTIYKFIEAVLK